jgi:hypothetical protein
MIRMLLKIIFLLFVLYFLLCSFDAQKGNGGFNVSEKAAAYAPAAFFSS